MKVQDVMVKDVKFCSLDTNLAAATEMLWTDGCGTLPVVNARGAVVGIITDRDICIALGTRNVLAAETTVGAIALPKLFSVKPEDDIHAALNTMAAQKIRRLPVIDNRGTLKGILSIDDIVLYAEAIPAHLGDVSYDDVASTFKSICERSAPPVPLALAK